MFNDFIKHYNIIRNILRDCFLYGYYSLETMEKKQNISARKVSYELRRIQQFVDEKFISQDLDGRYKLLSLTYDQMQQCENFLVSTFKTKSFTQMDLQTYYWILMVLTSSNYPLSASQIEDNLVREGIIEDDTVSSKTLERKLQEMCDEVGNVTKEVVKRTKQYQLSPDLLMTFSEKELEALLTAIQLYKNRIFPVTAGYFVAETLVDYILYERNWSLVKKEVFSFRQLFFHPIIEEEVYFDLMKAIHAQRKIVLNYGKEKDCLNPYHSNPLIPYKIRYDGRYGRFYLVAFNNRQKCLIARLDRIDSVELLKGSFVRADYDLAYETQMQHSWSSVALPEGKTPEKVTLEIHVVLPSEKYLLDKILHESPEGTLMEMAPGKYQFSFLVNDSGELVPWLRGYAGHVKVLESPALARRIVKDWKEMRQHYGIV